MKKEKLEAEIAVRKKRLEAYRRLHSYLVEMASNKRLAPENREVHIAAANWAQAQIVLIDMGIRNRERKLQEL